METKRANHPLSPRINSWAKGRFIALFLTAFMLSACATQDDADVLFSDTEKEIIKTLVYSDPPDDPTNAYDQDSGAAALGQKFFWDTQFSGPVTVLGNRSTTFLTGATGATQLINCASCHNPDFGWADNNTKPNDVSLGTNFTSRNSPTILNAVFNTYSLWDGSADSPWAVMRAPFEGTATHNFGRVGVAYIICNSPAYKLDYEAVFTNADTGGATPICTTPVAIPAPASGNSYGKITSTYYATTLSSTEKAKIDRIFANFSKAIAAYERKIVSKNSAFDQWAAGDENAMTVAQKRGLKIFIGKGNCVRCHSGANFSDGKFHNLGVPQVGGFSGSNDQGRYTGIAKLKDTTDNGGFNTLSSFNDSPSTDRVSSVTANSSDIGAFKTPTLRSVNKTPPYFHNGTFSSLWDVVNFYNFAGNGGNFPGTKDPILTTRKMTNEELEDLVSFLKALEGEALPSSVTTAPTTLPAKVNAGSW